MKKNFEDMYCASIQEAKYAEQQMVLNRVADELGVVAYRPNYHHSGGDANTVLFYTKEVAEHNRKVDAQPYQYSKGEAADLSRAWKQEIPGKYIYADYFFAFENTDRNGMKDLQFANRGTIDLRALDWKLRLEGAVRLAYTKMRQNEYIAGAGGPLGIAEADDAYNNLNRMMIEAYFDLHRYAYLGQINIHEQKLRAQMERGNFTNVFTPFMGQKVYNFGCDFVVPVKDEELAKLIRKWNCETKSEDLEKIEKKIKDLDGIQFIWY